MMWLFRRPKKPLSEADKHYQEALHYRNRNKKDFDLGLAIWHLKQALKYEPANPLFHCQLGRAYAAAPLLAVTRGFNGKFRLSESASMAAEELKEAIRLKPDYAEAHLMLGEAYMYLGEDNKAIQAFDAVMELKCNRKMYVHAEIEREHVEGGISKNPQPEEARRHLEKAKGYRDRRKYRMASMELNKAIKASPDWPWLYKSVCELGIR